MAEDKTFGSEINTIDSQTLPGLIINGFKYNHLINMINEDFIDVLSVRVLNESKSCYYRFI